MISAPMPWPHVLKSARSSVTRSSTWSIPWRPAGLPRRIVGTVVHSREGSTVSTRRDGPIISGVSTSDPIADGPVVDRLRALHEHYVDAVNRAVADDRDDLVAELVADYPDEALALLAPGQVDTEPWSSAPERLPSTIRGRPRGVFDHGRVARWMSAVRAAIW
jgi:hypothetical protein